MWEKLKNEKCIVACSGGPDSMALLHMAQQHHLSIVVAHVNYHQRESALRDQKIVQDWCYAHHVTCYVCDANQTVKGNFQAWARKVRYTFFQEIAALEEVKHVLVAHHEDDVLETYYMQKKRGSTPAYWGIQPSVYMYDLHVKRPLLNVNKQELIEYCEAYHITYGWDESNDSLKYARNQIRHKIIAKLTNQQKQQLLEEMIQRNHKQNNDLFGLQSRLHPKIDYASLILEEDPHLFLRHWIFEYADLQLSDKMISNILIQLKSDKNIEIELDKYVKLSKAYNQLEIIGVDEVSYCYVLDKIEMIRTPYFKIQGIGRTIEGVTLDDSDFPLTIRNAQAGDFIQLRYGTKYLSRWFIDRKIPKHLRKTWPVIENSSKKIIFVAKIGCDIQHYSNNPSCFMVE